MIRRTRRWGFLIVVVTLSALLLHRFYPQHFHSLSQTEKLTRPGLFHWKFRWGNVPLRYPVHNVTKLPSGPAASIPRIQADFEPEKPAERATRIRRLDDVREAFLHSWEGYKRNAWLQDEVAPVSGKAKNGFGGWGATLVDSLDTLWIMGLHDEFHAAVLALRNIDFSTSPMEVLNVFETTIRYLGGLLSAYDVSGHKYKILLNKAVDVGEMLYVAFDTPNRMPVTRWDWRNGATGGKQEALKHSFLAEVGSLTLEFTRLSQLTGDHKWYDAVARVTDVFYAQQNKTRVPGLWPVQVEPMNNRFNSDLTFSLGSQADSFYEYLPKEHLLLGGRIEQYREMYLTSLQAAKEHLFFQLLNPKNKKLLMSGTVQRHSALPAHLPVAEHLSCFLGGMVALGAKIFNQTHDFETARQLVDGCLWAYESMPAGIMPELFHVTPCVDTTCRWREKDWVTAIASRTRTGVRAKPKMRYNEAQQVIKDDKLPPGITEIIDPRYYLRPEAIESVFVLYRTTGDKTLQEQAWTMFQTIKNATRTKIAFAGLRDVTESKADRRLIDEMQSFWTAETLKYFYLIFSEPHYISLDEYVLNTEAHPLLRPK